MPDADGARRSASRLSRSSTCPATATPRRRRRWSRTWTRSIHAYLRGRATLKRVFILVDARHGIRPTDETVMDELDRAAVSYQIVLTKADKVKPHELARHRGGDGGGDPQAPGGASASPRHLREKGAGLDAVRAEIAAFSSSS